MFRVGIIILAAGASSRLGRPKQLVSFQGESLILRATQTALASVCQPIVVVLGAHAEGAKDEILHLPVAIAHNPNWELGMASSIKTGLEAMAALETAQAFRTEAVLLMVSDQPFLTPSIVNHLAYNFLIYGGIIASAYNGTLGVPAVFGRDFHDDLISLPPDQGAKSVIHRHLANVRTVSFPEGAIDIDTPEDYERLRGGTPGVHRILQG